MRIYSVWGDAWDYEGEVDHTGQPFGECTAICVEDRKKTYQGTCINGIFEGLGKCPILHINFASQIKKM